MKTLTKVLNFLIIFSQPIFTNILIMIFLKKNTYHSSIYFMNLLLIVSLFSLKLITYYLICTFYILLIFESRDIKYVYFYFLLNWKYQITVLLYCYTIFILKVLFIFYFYEILIPEVTFLLLWNTYFEKQIFFIVMKYLFGKLFFIVMEYLFRKTKLFFIVI